MSSFSSSRIRAGVLLPSVLILITSAYAAAQSSVVTPNSMDPDAVQHRIERARALAAAHQLEPAAQELESLRASVTDTALRNITSLMLMGIYLEDANYVRSQAILEETFQARSAPKDDSIRTYFALAGQAIIGVRSHLARYRSFGINPSDSDLPPEALSDLDRLRNLLERMAAQAQEITNANAKAYDALALQEDVLGLRLSLARDTEDRAKWQTEYANAREHLAAAQIQIASIGKIPSGSATPRILRSTPVEKPSASDKTNQATGAGQSPASTSAAGSAENTISAGSLNGRETKRVTPAYPPIAKTTGSSGLVRVYVTVDENGKVSVTKSEGPALLRQPAEDAAKGWSFSPTIVEGKPVRVSGYIDFEFKL